MSEAGESCALEHILSSSTSGSTQLSFLAPQNH